MENKSLEERVSRLESIQEITNLMGKWVYQHSASMHKENLKLYAQKTPGIKEEISNIGTWEGTKGLTRNYTKVLPTLEGDRVGQMYLHPLTTQVIEIGSDGKTAKGVWISPGNETMVIDGKPKAFWGWLKFGVDFVKEDNVWKIWHLHLYGLFHCPYETSWVETGETVMPPPPDELKPDRPSSYNHPYSTTTTMENIPEPPEPYDTFDPEKAY